MKLPPAFLMMERNNGLERRNGNNAEGSHK